MAPANRAWIRSKMAAIKKTSGIAFSEEIFLSILICLTAKNKHLVLHTTPEAVPELKSTAEQHCAVVFGLTTATIVCHGQQTRTDIIGAITGRHADMATHASYSTPSTQYQLPNSSAHHSHHSHHNHQQTPSGQYYQYSNPTDEYYQRNPKLRLEKSRRSVATNYSEASDFSVRPSGHNVAPSIASFRTTSERDQDAASIQRVAHPLNDTSEYSFGGGVGGDDASFNLRPPESKSKSTGDTMVEQLAYSRSRKSTTMSPTGTDGLDSLTPRDSISRRTAQTAQYLQATSHTGGGASTGSSHAPVTPVDFTFPRRRHESFSNVGGYGGVGETSGITYSGRKIAQAIILDGLENASQEVFSVLLEMIVNKEINDRNRYVLPDLIIIAIFNSPNVPENVPKRLLDYFAINGTYQPSIPQPRMHTVPARKHALFRRTDWDELSKRMKVVTVSNDMTRYIRDVIVAIRTHEAVYGGLTARAALDLEAIMKTLAAIFQTNFVTPDLLTIAAEKVFSHRIELKSARRQRMLAAATGGAGSSSVSSSSGPYRNIRSSQGRNNGKTPLRGTGQTPPHILRKGSTDSEASGSIGGDSFVEHSSDSEGGSSHAGGGGSGDDDGGSVVDGRGGGDDGGASEVADETTAADVVRDVLRVVYPPI
ncbi:hypothetical protein EC957_002725 [Mortierella hygrophila]|uniref:magnesium chelatase n=1 Tax=Mortierella hygrophila TaxID=979708 RepID=A0A9P6F4D4_9FUNG|nr:hypothetical protein EC957_002725 [Mortierella hygrophila]